MINLAWRRTYIHSTHTRTRPNDVRSRNNKEKWEPTRNFLLTTNVLSARKMFTASGNGGGGGCVGRGQMPFITTTNDCRPEANEMCFVHRENFRVHYSHLTFAIKPIFDKCRMRYQCVGYRLIRTQTQRKGKHSCDDSFSRQHFSFNRKFRTQLCSECSLSCIR